MPVYRGCDILKLRISRMHAVSGRFRSAHAAQGMLHVGA